MKKIDLLVTGVGGQGVILASDIISETALASGYDVKKTDTLGMAQRGGSVISHVRIADKVYSPQVKAGEVDILLALEKLEAARWSHYLRPGGIAIVNNHALPPPSVSLGKERYPTDEEITNLLKRRTDHIYFIEGTRRAKEMGEIRAVNTFMLGGASVFLPFKASIWKECITQRLPAKVRHINITMFDQGRKEISSARSEAFSPFHTAENNRRQHQ